jgi:hypothetical protein
MSSSSTDAPQSEIFDSLPYYDNDLELFPILKQKVEQELAREPKPPPTLHPKVPPPPKLFAVRKKKFRSVIDNILNIGHRTIRCLKLNSFVSNHGSLCPSWILSDINFQRQLPYPRLMKNGTRRYKTPKLN